MRGVYLLLIGDPIYAHWAVNLAASVKFYSPDMHISLLHEPGIIEHIQEHERIVFNEFIEIDPAVCRDGEKLTPGIAKLNMYKYFHHEENLYIDVDSLMLKDINGLFDQNKDKIIGCDVVSKHNEKSELWPCIWATLPDVKNYYQLPETYTLFEINSSYIYTKKCDEAERFWNQAKDNIIKDYEGRWGKSFPDELAFDVAFAQTGINPETKTAISCDSKLSGSAKGVDALKDHYFILTYWGGKNNNHITHYKNYDMLAGVIHRKILGKHNPYKYSTLMRNKYVQTNRSNLTTRQNVVLPPVIMSTEKKIREFIDNIPTELSYNDTTIIDSKKLLQFITVKGKRTKVTNWFNGSIYKYNDQIYFAYRVDFYPWFKHTTNCICKLDENYQPIPQSNKQLFLKNDINGHNSEDPYLFTNEDGKLCIAYTDGYKVGYGVFDEQLNVVSNYIVPKNPGGDKYDGREKNWTPIDGTTKFIYNCNRTHIIYEYKDHAFVNEYHSDNKSNWEYGVMRGGSTAIKHKNLYYHFFHSSMEMNNGIKWGRVYVMGCYVFDENYRVVKVSKQPILKGEFIDMKTPRPANSVFVCFPRGVVREQDGFMVSFGSNDYENRLVKITDEFLKNTLINV